MAGNFFGFDNLIFQLFIECVRKHITTSTVQQREKNELNFPNDFWSRCAISILMNWKWWEEAKYQNIIALQSLRFGLHSKWQRINITFNLRLFFPNNELNGVIIFNEQFHFIEWTTSSYHRLNPSNASLRLFCCCGNGIAREQMVTAKSLNKCNIKSPRLRSMQTRIKTAANALHPHVLVLYCLILLLSMWHRLCKSAANTYKGFEFITFNRDQFYWCTPANQSASQICLCTMFFLHLFISDIGS